MKNNAHAVSFTRTLRLKVKRENYPWLNAAATEVNQVWNYCAETSLKAMRPVSGLPKWLSGFDLNNLTAGVTEFLPHIGADSVQRVCGEYATKRKQARKLKLRWRVSRGARRSLGWVPFKAASIKRKGSAVRFCGKTFRVFEADKLEGVKWKQGCFAQDAVGDWWLCLPVEVQQELDAAPNELVGVDLGLKAIATTSDGDALPAGQFYRRMEPRISEAQRRGHKRQAKRLHRKAARQRQDALHKFSRKLVDQYQTIIIGDVRSAKLAKTKMAKSVHDAGWYALKQMCQYKGEHAGRTVEIVNEAFTTRACSACGALTGPAGRTGLVVREWRCSDCGTEHDRDVNAARNIAILGSRCRTSVRGNESSGSPVPSSRLHRRRETGTETARSAA